MSTEAIDPIQTALGGETVGPPLSGVQAASAIALGVGGLLIIGVLPVLLPALAAEQRLAVGHIGDAAMAEALTTGLITGLCGALLKPVRLRVIGALAILALVAADLAMTKVSGPGVIALRAAAGAPEAVLLWITISMIARTATPERWAGIFFTSLAIGQFALAAVLTAGVVPQFHANGGFILVAILVLACLPAVLLGADRFAPLPQGEGVGAPPVRGWIALAGTLLFTGASAAVAIYLVPLAHQADLGAKVGGTAVAAALAAQILGSAVATLIAGRYRYFAVFVVAMPVMVLCWVIYMFWPPAWLFVAAAALGGFAGLLASPFLVPMAIEADPTRRAAVQIGGAHLFGGALGPFLASRVVDEHQVHGVVVLGAVLMIAALSIFGGLHLTTRRSETAEAD